MRGPSGRDHGEAMIASRRLVVALALACCGCAGEKADGRPWIHRITLDGVKHLSARDLKKHIALEKTNWLGYPKQYLDPFEVDGDRARIEAYYQAHGYFQARVTAAEVKPHKGPADHPTAVDVHLTIDEGEPTKIAAVELGGLDGLRAKKRIEKETLAKLKVGAVFDHGTYLAQKDVLVERLKEHAHAWAKVEGVVEIDRDRNEARIKLTATPGPFVRYGHLHVNGCARVRERDIERHARVQIREGARFHPEDLEDLRGKLYQLGVFSSVRVELEPSIGDPTVADVIISVKEGTFNELRIGLGLGLESQRTDAHAAFIYTRRNFLRGLRTLRLRIEPAWVAIPAFWNNQRTGPQILAEGTLTQPDRPWPGAMLKWTVGYDIGIEYAYQYHGPRTSLGVTHAFWHQRVLVGLSYNFQFLQFFNTDPVILNDPAQAGQLFGFVDPYRLGWWQQDLALDLRDHPLDAHKGLYVGAGLEEGGVYAGGAFQYEKLGPDLRFYVPMGGRVTLAGRAQFGQILVQGDLGSPVTRRFYLGGPNSHRGFNYNRLSYQVPSGVNGIPPIPIGGDQMVLGQLELRVNIVQLFGQWLALAAFWDAGDVAAPSCASTAACQIPGARTTVSLGELHHAVGGGIRYKTVIGSIRFDLGVRLNRLAPTEPDGTPNPDPGQRFAFHISVGEAF